VELELDVVPSLVLVWVVFSPGITQGVAVRSKSGGGSGVDGLLSSSAVA